MPREAVQGDATNRVVYVADFDLPNSFVKSSVVTGEENDQYIEIKSGLFPGDEVVTKGAYLLGFAGGAETCRSRKRSTLPMVMPTTRTGVRSPTIRKSD